MLVACTCCRQLVSVYDLAGHRGSVCRPCEAARVLEYQRSRPDWLERNRAAVRRHRDRKRRAS